MIIESLQFAVEKCQRVYDHKRVKQSLMKMMMKNDDDDDDDDKKEKQIIENGFHSVCYFVSFICNSSLKLVRE